MEVPTATTGRRPGISEKLVIHLKRALQTDSIEEKNYHIRTALQYQFGTLDNGPPTETHPNQRTDPARLEDD